MSIEHSILITGASSMIGRAVYKLVDPKKTTRIYHKDWDLTKWDETVKIFDKYRPTAVINLAGHNGGIKYNKEAPATIFSINTRIAMNVLEAAAQFNVEKLISVIPSCSYPDLATPFEKNYYDGKPHDSVACHGLAKRNLVAYSEMLAKQGLANYITCCLNTVYGPFDKFNDNAKVVGSLIRKFFEAKNQKSPYVELWGSGAPKRGFIYCEDAAHAILHCLENYNVSCLPINVPSEETTVAELAETIKRAVDFDGEIVWDKKKPDGQMRKLPLTAKSKYKAKFSLERGIHLTVQWCKQNCEWANV